MKYVLFGLLFGLGLGTLMRLPALTTFLPAYAITITAMATLWLGALLVPRSAHTRPGGFWDEVSVAGVTYAFIAGTMQIVPEFIFLAMGLQIAWSLTHWRFDVGAAVEAWYPPFASGANVGLLVAFIVFWWVF